MSIFAGKTIGEWTPAQLQSFLQNVVRLEQTALPPSARWTGLDAGAMRITGQLSFDDDALLMKKGVKFPPFSFVAADFTGAAEPMWAETTGTATWRAAGGTIMAQSGDLSDSTGDLALTDGRVTGSIIYLPTKGTVRHLHVFVTEVPSAINGQAHEVGLFGHTGSVTAPTYAQIEAITGLGSSLTGSVGFKTFDFSRGIVLDAGVYLATVISKRSSMTGNLKLASTPASAQGINGSNLGAYPRTAYKDGQSAIPSSFSPDGHTANRVWFGLS